MTLRVALLEDDPYQAEMIRLVLTAAGHLCDAYATGRRFIEAVRAGDYQLLILDWELPDTSGDEVLRWVRENLGWEIPVLFVTLRDREEDVVRVLEMGADDYMAKPIRNMELLARVNALGRRVAHNEGGGAVREHAPFRIDLDRRTVSRGGHEIDLTRKEFDLAAFLFDNEGRALSRDELLERVWGRGGGLNTRTVDTHISRLRHKLGLDGEGGWSLRTVHSYGYRLERTEAG